RWRPGAIVPGEVDPIGLVVTHILRLVGKRCSVRKQRRDSGRKGGTVLKLLPAVHFRSPIRIREELLTRRGGRNDVGGLGQQASMLLAVARRCLRCRIVWMRGDGRKNSSGVVSLPTSVAPKG